MHHPEFKMKIKLILNECTKIVRIHFIRAFYLIYNLRKLLHKTLVNEMLT